MSGVLGTACGALVVIGVVAAVFWHVKARADALGAVWAGVAARRGGRYGASDPGRVGTLEVRVSHALVRVVLSGRDLDDSTSSTRAWARFAAGEGPRFDVQPKAIWSSAGPGGTTVLALGDGALDAELTVRGDHPPAVRAAWSERARLACRSLGGVHASSDGRRVQVEVPGALDDPRRLDALLDLTGELASAGASILDALAATPGASLVPASGPFHSPEPPFVRIATERGAVTATLVGGSRATGLRLEIESPRELPAFRAEVREGEPHGLPRGLLTEPAVARMTAANGATLAADGSTLSLEWPVAPPGEVARDGVRILAELAAAPRKVGVFR